MKTFGLRLVDFHASIRQPIRLRKQEWIMWAVIGSAFHLSPLTQALILPAGCETTKMVGNIPTMSRFSKQTQQPLMMQGLFKYHGMGEVIPSAIGGKVRQTHKGDFKFTKTWKMLSLLVNRLADSLTTTAFGLMEHNPMEALLPAHRAHRGRI